MSAPAPLPTQPAPDPGAAIGRLDRIGMWLGPLAIAALFVWMAHWSNTERANPELAALWILIVSLPWALLWLAAAIGLGWPLRRLLAPDAEDGFAIQCAAGVALLMFIDSAAGTSGLLQVGGAAGAWIVIIAGIILVIEQLRRRLMASDRVEIVVPWPVWAAAPTLAVILIATCVAPGWLWTTEFGGYDAMSYHLELPKEWLGFGAIVPLDYNVYSHLPSFMEGAYYHLAVLIGDGIDSVYADQMLHASLAVLAAWLAGRVGRRIAGPLGGLIAALAVLGTPWVIVTGTLGYNDMAMTLMLAAGLLVLFAERIEPHRQSALLGLLIGAACGAKLTAGGFVALPLVVLLLWRHPPRRWPQHVALVACFCLLVLAPWLVANALDTGNPTFPFLTSLFGTGHWTAKQAATWARGHQLAGGVGARLSQAVQQFFRYGLGPNPHGDEPWKAQWSILPWLSALALLMGLTSTSLRRVSLKLTLVIVIQLAFWTFFTHVRSRFMLPAVLPMALSLSIALAWLRETTEHAMQGGLARTIIFVVLLAWCCQPMLLYSSEKGGNPSAMIDMANVLSGRDLTESERRELGATQFVAVYVNYVLPPDAKVLMVGHATPLYFQRPVVYQTTWDRGPLSRIMREYGENPAAWIDALKTEGFTHLLVRPEMLKNWERAGWNDPLITADRIMNAADLYATVEQRYPNGTVLYRLERPVRPTLPPR